ncbi:hypothetical protein RF11_10945 [Thelohanellus kitauei]|uniref:Uncharacterized protein n=1 Tax=Thelohanellus kitauei TaxID=669202 RepID=A0A0C2MRC3_THEKT|nr:hypothetical protein RF11_10945 [Thelohanellus kitauei]
MVCKLLLTDAAVGAQTIKNNCRSSIKVVENRRNQHLTFPDMQRYKECIANFSMYPFEYPNSIYKPPYTIFCFPKFCINHINCEVLSIDYCIFILDHMAEKFHEISIQIY